MEIILIPRSSFCSLNSVISNQVFALTHVVGTFNFISQSCKIQQVFSLEGEKHICFYNFRALINNFIWDLGYANEVGESFRQLVSIKLVRLSYIIASTYCLADASSKAKKIVSNKSFPIQLLCKIFTGNHGLPQSVNHSVIYFEKHFTNFQVHSEPFRGTRRTQLNI